MKNIAAPIFVAALSAFPFTNAYAVGAYPKAVTLPALPIDGNFVHTDKRGESEFVLRDKTEVHRGKVWLANLDYRKSWGDDERKALAIPPQAVALLAVLFLRGPQTAGELRINSDRLHKFGDILAVEGFLHELAERPDAALVRELAKQPGARETRWVHLVSGEPVIAASAAEPAQMAGDAVSASELAAMKANIDHLGAEVTALKEIVARLCKELGIAT